MKNPTLKITFVVAIAAGLGLAWNLSAEDNTDREASAESPRWQHLALEHNTAKLGNDADLGRQINKLGREGWEMVTVLNFSENGSTGKTMYYFKRPL